MHTTEWTLRDTGSEGYGSKAKIHFRNGDSVLCNITFLDGPLKNACEVTFIHLLRPVGSSSDDAVYKYGDRVEVYDPESRYDRKRGTIDCEVQKGRPIYVKLDAGERIFTYTKFIKQL